MSSQPGVLSDTIHVLHVDDEPDFADMAGTFLQRKDDRFTIETATSASDGLTHLNNAPVDCIVSDYDMPAQNGIEFLKTVREEYPDLPFILYTGKGSEEIASDAISAGVTDYLQKGSGTSQYTVLANRIRNTVEQYRSKHQIEASQQRLSLFFDQSPLGVIEWTENFEVARLNDTAEDILGYSEEELRGDSWERIVPDADRTPVSEVVDQLLDAEGGYHSINNNIRKDGEQIVCEWHNRVVTDDDGETVAIFSQFEDITDENERKAELRRKERRYQAMFNDPNILVGLIDTDGSVLDINDTAMEYIDAPFEDIAGEAFWKTPWFNHNETVQREVQDWIERAANGEYVEFETDLVRPTGDSYTVEGNVRPVTNEDGEVVSLLISDRDITEQKAHERELERTNAVRSTLFDTLPVGVLAEDAERNVLAVNDQMSDLFGVFGTRDGVVGVDCQELAERAGELFVDGDGFVKRIDELKAEQESTDTEELALVDGRTYERSYRPLELPDGDGHLWVYRDITDRKERERRYDAIFNKTYQFTGLLEPDGTLIETNEAALNFGGLERTEVIGKKMWDAYWFQLSDETRTRARNAVERAADGEFVRQELPVQGADREVIIDFSVRPITDERGEVVLLVPEGRDITELKEREQALQRERDRLDKFASVVSHDLQSPLSVAKGRLELAQEECGSEHLDAIETAIARIERITEDVLWLARSGRDIGSVESISLGNAIDSAWEMVSDGEEQAEIVYADELSSVDIQADADRLRQLLENLLRNAIKHSSGDVTVTVGTLSNGIYIEDDGPGIPEAQREDVFSPGYSSDENGTGFGLSIVKQIAEAHGWHISVNESAEGGARFEISGLESTE